MKKNWKEVKLGDLCKVITKGTTPTSIGFRYLDKGINFVKVESIDQRGYFLNEKFAHIGEDCNEKLKRSQLKTGDILFSIAGALGRTAIVNENILPANTNQALSIIRLKSNSKVNLNFLKTALNSGYTLEQVNKNKGGVAQQNLSLTQVKNFKIPLPPLSEQKAIVTKLDQAFKAIDQAIANLEKNITNAENLKASRINNLFEEIDKDAKLLSINDICTDIFAGGDKPKPNFSKIKTNELKIPVVSNSEKNHGFFGYTNKARVFQKSITITARGSIGHIEKRNYQYFPIVRLIVLIPDLEKLTHGYFYYALKSLEILNTGSSIPQLTVPMIKKSKIYLPSFQIQKDITEKAEKIESITKAIIQKYQQKLNSLEELKQSILEKAFCGELV